MKNFLLVISIIACYSNIFSKDFSHNEFPCVNKAELELNLNSEGNSLNLFFVDPPTNTTIQCDEVYNFIPEVSTTCPTGAIVTATDINLNNTLNCPTVLTYQRFYLAQDECGGIATHIENITVIDTEGPLVFGCPNDTVTECPELIPLADVTFLDNCDDTLSITYTETVVNEFGAVADSCSLFDSSGSSDEQLWAFWFPAFPADYGLEDQFIWDTSVPASFVRDGDMAFITGRIHALDNPNQIFDVMVKAKDRVDWTTWSSLLTVAPPFINRSFKDTPGFAAAGGDLWETWDYYVIDETQSTLIGQGDLAGSNLQLFHEPMNLLFGLQVGQAANNKNANFGMSAWYNYVGDLVIDGTPFNVDGFGDLNFDSSCQNFPQNVCEYELSRKWTAIDDCGNLGSCEQIITVIDTVAPTFINCPEDITVECDNVPPVPVVEAEDLCGDVMIVYTEQTNPNPQTCPVLEEILRIWTATDECGNVSICTQTVTIEDTTPPVISCPPDLTLDCSDGIPGPAVAGEALASDNCLNVVIDFTDGVLTGSCPITLTRTWTATDECGNSASCDQIISFDDTTSPTIIAGDDITISCDENLPVPNFSVSDDCDSDPSVSISDNTTPGDCEHNFFIERTYTATDICGNSSSDMQLITILDNVAPVLTIPGDITISCDDPIPPANQGTVVDNCDVDASISANDVILPGNCPQNYIIERTYGSTDDCGNSSQSVQLITVQDTEAPINLNPPADITIECDEDEPIYIPLWEDNCGAIEETAISSISTDGCTDIISQTYTATDECGNSKSVSRTITITDTTPPTITAAADLTLECDEFIPGPSYNANDNCDDDLTIDIDETTIPGSCPYEYTIQRIYTATDDCGNSASDIQIIDIQDTTPPVFLEDPQDITLECDIVIDPNPNLPAEDNCSDVIVEFSATSSGDSCETIVIWTWTATDECGNSSSVNATITYVDTTPPTLTVNPDITVECGDDIPGGAYVVDDNCSEVDVILSQVNTPGCGNTYTKTRTYTATDACGNSTTAVQLVHVIDTTPPTLTVGVDQTIECGDTIPLPEFEASDLCGIVDVEVDDVFFPGCGLTGTIVRNYQASDECGNFTTAEQLITIIDTTPPAILNPPSNLTIECDEDVPLYEPIWLEACGDITQSAISGISPDGCNEIISQTYFAEDECGNQASVSRTITVVDTTPPTILAGPDVTIECDDDLPGLSFTASDNCDLDLNITTNEQTIPGPCPNQYTIERTYTATDDCGNSSSDIQLIIVVDTTPPVFLVDPDDITVECDVVVTVSPTLPAEDNCGDVTVTISSTSSGDLCELITIYTWTATDECGNSSSVSASVTNIDTTPPTIEAAPDAIVECDEALPAQDYIAEDNCNDFTVIVDESITPGNCPQEYILTRTYIATDDCGNSASDVQEITVVDTTPPLVIAAGDITIECDESIPAPSYTVTDNCEVDPEVLVTQTSTPGSCPQEETILRLYTAIDLCGNSSTDTQLITIVDATAPEIQNPPSDIIVECDADIPVYEPIWIDNCGDVTVSAISSISTDGCSDFIFQTYFAEDECGNEASVSRTITVVDTTPPTIIAAPDVTIECDQLPPVPSYIDDDNCDEDLLIVITEDVQPGACPQESTITRTYTATDDCGNSSSDVQIISILDTTPPVFLEIPQDIIVECDVIIDPNPFLPAEDNCDENVTVTFSSSVSGTLCVDLVETWTWTATDDCGNSSSVSATITYIDTTPPAITAAPDATVECDEDIPTPSHTTSDNCDPNPSVTVSQIVINGICPQEFTIERTYTATDDCGNQSSDIQLIFVQDTTPPQITAAGDLTIECDEDIPVESFTVSDNCDLDPDVLVTQTTTPGNCPQEITITRLYTATDDCGNTSSDVQVINIVDTTDPIIIPAPDLTLECDDPIPVPSFIVSDNCDLDPTVTIAIQSLDGSCEDELTILRTYTAIDACGNLASAVQTITIQDTTPPTLIAAGDLTLECDESVPGPSQIISDNCDSSPEIDVDEQIIMGSCPQEFSIIRTYTATDNCGNSSTDTQTINVVDTTAPEITAGPDLTVECDEPIPGPSHTTTDNCDLNPSVTVAVIETPGNCPQELVIIRTYTATDDCGNTSSDVQIINVVDTTDPVITVDPDITIECDQPIPGPGSSASDNCDPNPVVTFSENTIPGNCPQESIIIRTYTATDACGNSASATQTITIEDTTAPTLSIAPDVTIECDMDIPPPGSSSQDNCDLNPFVSVSETTIAGNCPQESTILRLYTASDACGNSTSATQVITIVDITPPTITAAPDITIECDEVIPAPSSITNDNCDPNPTVTVDSDTAPGNCPQEFIITRTYTATDACGNSSSDTQTIIVQDTTAPEIEAAGDLTLECDETIPGPSQSVSDNCDLAPTVEVMTQTIPGSCPQEFTLIRTYTATDACGNTSSDTQTITVQDTTAPELEAAGDLTLECDETIPAPSQIVSDNCDSAPSVDVSILTIPGNCPQEFTLIRTYTATDACGNTSSDTQTITVQDTTAPELEAAGDLTLECDEAIPDPSQTVSDNCDLDPIVEVTTETIPGNCSQEFTLIRTYTATDACGNSSSDTQTIIVQDTTAPDLIVDADDTTVECDMIPDPAMPLAIDNCDVFVEIDFDETATDGCPYTITRTWTATDDCGNSTSHTQIITVIDTTPPTLSIGADTVIECDEPTPAPEFEADDNCWEPVVAVDEDIIPGDCPQNYTIERTYTATDECGNSTSDTQLIVVQDTTPPSLIEPNPADTIKECYESGLNVYLLADYINGTLSEADSLAVLDDVKDLFDQCELIPEVIDNCSDTELINYEYVIQGFNSQKYPDVGYLECTFLAIDDCGNQSPDTVTTSITIIDSVFPNAECQDITVELGPDGYTLLDPSQIDNGSSDNCGPVFLSLSKDSLTCDDVGTNLIQLLVFDLGGNLSICSANVELVNNNESGLVCPDDLTVSTDKDQCTHTFEPGQLIAKPMDPCENMEYMSEITLEDGTTWIAGQDAAGQYPIGTHTIVWTAVGEDGTVYSCSTTLTVVDDQGPNVLCKNITATINNFQVIVPAQSLSLFASDNCSTNLIYTVNGGQDFIEFTCDDLGINAVTLEVTDEAGNMSTCLATVNVQDNEGLCDPVDPCPAPTDLETTINNNNNTFTLSFTPPPGAIKCKIKGGVLGGNDNATVSVPGPNPSSKTLSQNLLNPNLTYQWKVKCKCQNNPALWSDYSEYDYFSLNNPIQQGFEGNEEANDTKISGFEGISAKVYPNPNNGSFFIETDIEEYNVRIIDLSGKVVYSEDRVNAQLYSIELDYVESGFYFIRLFNEYGVEENIKIIVE